ncbi:MAG TPA: DUF3972 domain-containing protein [Nitratifractor salsuginis]|uniref:DUF3972 domain-containing protein n=1 Tax=Nitratifractor salsuginis TaxID=269261 RepID=A0A7V2WLR5_9BACT|nr:DUF3972 domain-containing protein [Nitratifractor salsuginis]
MKPVDYAKKMGISRQAVYAKIKKGILPSRNVGGKIYIVLKSEAPSEKAADEGELPEIQPLLAAKDETIAVLKETIRDLKETNQMITSTLRSEVELLKEAFAEMKTLYAARIEQINTAEETLPLQEVIAEEAGEAEDAEEDTWITLEKFLAEQGIRKKKQRERFTKKTKKLYKKGDTAVEKKKGAYRLKAERAVEILLGLKES